MVALTLARCALEKFGGDSMTETLRNFEGYCEQLKKYYWTQTNSGDAETTAQVSKEGLARS